MLTTVVGPKARRTDGNREGRVESVYEEDLEVQLHIQTVIASLISLSLALQDSSARKSPLAGVKHPQYGLSICAVCAVLVFLILSDNGLAGSTYWP